MKVLIGASYGPALLNFRKDFIQETVKRGHQVICVSAESGELMEADIRILGASYESVGGSRTGMNLMENLAVFFRYIHVIRKVKPDICFFFMAKPIVFGGSAAILCRVKHIYSFVTGLETVFYTKGIKDFMIRNMLCLFYTFIFHHNEKCFFMNQDDFKSMRKRHLIKKGKEVIVNGSGVNMEHFERIPIPDSPCVCMTARLVQGKGVKEYCSAASSLKKKHPQADFLLVGGLDEHKDAILEEELISYLEDGAVTYCGYADDVRPYLKKCSVFVLPSYHEGNGRSIVEAMAAGRAIVTTNAPGCKETVIEGYNGFLVPVGDSPSLAEKIDLLLQKKELRESMGENSYLLCREKFEVRQINTILLNTMGL
ncbi:glycosyltransferase family 4 protein [Anaerocolumna xylanovorans]|uniref:Glycosyltransferase involved in cell wall bisynthesis n=1 Tax=Anaerocolumna xylanovorans DSM 12503 TaxID=1121345 RepID=A0A1M7Y1P5_9FIRM|nr:glycosyltransferase family 4 protein [Anaerocolumna xylanovorans]SHO45694.1 Glycosyltransferase involved in cell wall bisynthesis [Anaerocolumna xylanovorans DSM 12503]